MTLVDDIQTLRTACSALDLPAYEGWDASVHCFSPEEQSALRTALSADCPLLICGEPGTGKTQIARAAAVLLQRHFVSKTLNARTEIENLFWTKDVVRRLADAQLWSVKLGGWTRPLPTDVSPEQVEAFVKHDTHFQKVSHLLDTQLNDERYVHPGVLWWGFNWDQANQIREKGIRGEARAQASWVPPEKPASSVVLLDEIDKADPMLPQGLLEALGTGRFEGLEAETYIAPADGVSKPLIIITSNGERDLPHAFVRRCAVLSLFLPTGDMLKQRLIYLGQSHARTWTDCVPPDSSILEACADVLVTERDAIEAPRERPGPAEYLDILRAVCHSTADGKQRAAAVQELAPYIVHKYRALATTDIYA